MKDRELKMMLLAGVTVAGLACRGFAEDERAFPTTEFGAAVGAGFNAKGTFSSGSRANRSAISDPVAGIDHEYDDGYNRVDNLNNFGDATAYWGYDNASQYDDASRTVSMTASRTTVSEMSIKDDDSFDPELGFSVYWKWNLLERETWALGVKTSFRWQNIDLKGHGLYDAETRTVVDQYTYLPAAPYPFPPAGYQGPYTRGMGNTPLLSDLPARVSDTTTSSKIPTYRSLDADLYALDIGPAFSVWLMKDLSLVATVAGTIAYIDSDFSHYDSVFGSGSSSDDDWLFGFTSGLDVQYWIGEHWGVYAGAAYNYLEDFTQDSDGYRAKIDFAGCYDVHTGVFVAF